MPRPVPDPDLPDRTVRFKIGTLGTIITAVLSASIALGAGAWTLRGELATLATQAQLSAAVAGMDAKLGPIAGQIEKLADRVTDVDKRLSRLEGRMDSSPPRSP